MDEVFVYDFKSYGSSTRMVCSCMCIARLIWYLYSSFLNRCIALSHAAYRTMAAPPTFDKPGLRFVRVEAFGRGRSERLVYAITRWRLLTIRLSSPDATVSLLTTPAWGYRRIRREAGFPPGDPHQYAVWHELA